MERQQELVCDLSNGDEWWPRVTVSDLAKYSIIIIIIIIKKVNDTLKHHAASLPQPSFLYTSIWMQNEIFHLV